MLLALLWQIRLDFVSLHKLIMHIHGVARLYNYEFLFECFMRIKVTRIYKQGNKASVHTLHAFPSLPCFRPLQHPFTKFLSFVCMLFSFSLLYNYSAIIVQIYYSVQPKTLADGFL